jgi:hypothetical protein
MGFFGVCVLAACSLGAGSVGASGSLAAHHALPSRVVPSQSLIALQQPQMAPICGASMGHRDEQFAVTAGDRLPAHRGRA